jgi:hypothetical protein
MEIVGHVAMPHPRGMTIVTLILLISVFCFTCIKIDMISKGFAKIQVFEF